MFFTNKKALHKSIFKSTFMGTSVIKESFECNKDKFFSIPVGQAAV